MLTTLLLSLVATAAVSHAPTGAPLESTQDSIRALRAWTQRAKRARDGLTIDEQFALRDLIPQLRRARLDEPERSIEIDEALLDLAALRWIPSSRKTAEGVASDALVAEFGARELESRMREDTASFSLWLADVILAVDASHVGRKLVATDLLRRKYLVPTRSALMRTARTATGELAEAALDALVGWPDLVVHGFFLDSLEASGRGITALAAHFEAVPSPLNPSISNRLRALAGRLYLSDEWRDAARARSLVRPLDAESAVPVLIEALNVWGRRRSAGEGSKRIEAELVRELRRISGRSMGPTPDNWSRWWNAVLAGRVELPEDIEKSGGFVSSASFFGLEVNTDRVAFVIDRSGSMSSPFATNGDSRFDEAIDQFLKFLRQAGTRTRFSIVLFSDRGDRWQSGLRPATTANLERAERWLLRNPPGGGTHLFEGLRTALRLDRSGHLDAKRVAVDTVIVLCDGATQEGPEWVEAWIERENEEAQIVFHCVQIGRSGRGALAALAEASGGDFVRLR